jgi:hypothetical protein
MRRFTMYTRKTPIILFITSAVLLGALGCTNMFSTSYERVDPDMTRLIDFIYEPADAAPGDTVTLTAIFAGRKIPLENITWRVSFNTVVDPYGTTKAFDISAPT